MIKLTLLILFLSGLACAASPSPTPSPSASVTCQSWSFVTTSCPVNVLWGKVTAVTADWGGDCTAGNYATSWSASGATTLTVYRGCRGQFTVTAGPAPKPSPSPSLKPSPSPSATANPGPSASPWPYPLPLDSNGWSILPTTGKLIYVDSVKGKDTNPGTGSAPLQSLAAAQKMGNVAGPVHIYLARGSVWTTPVSFTWGYPLTIDGESYGSPTAARPQLANLDVWNGSNVVLAGLSFKGLGIGTAINIHNAATNVLIEDCVVDGYWQNIIAGPVTNFIMRRSQSINAWDAGFATTDESKPQGLFLAGINGGLIEENLFDHNGYHNSDFSDATMFAHDIYISNSASALSFNVVLRNNVISNGLQSFKGPATGTVSGNLFYLDGSPGYIGAQGGSVTGNAFIGNNQIRNVKTYHLSNPSGLNAENGGFNVDGNEGLSAGKNGLTTVQGNLYLNLAGSAFSPNDPSSNFIFTGNTIVNTDAISGFFFTPYKGVFSNNVFQGSTKCQMIYESNNPIGTALSWSGNTYYCSAGQASPILFRLQYAPQTWTQYLALSKESNATWKQVNFTTPSWAISWTPFLAGAKAQSRQTWSNAYTAMTPVQSALTAFQISK